MAKRPESGSSHHLNLTAVVTVFVKNAFTKAYHEQCHHGYIGGIARVVVVVRLSDRTHAGRVGEQLLTARAFPPWRTCCAQRPSLRLTAATPSFVGCAMYCLTTNITWSSYRTTRTERPTKKPGVAALRCGTGGALPPPFTGAGAPENAGAFTEWRLPQLRGGCRWRHART